MRVMGNFLMVAGGVMMAFGLFSSGSPGFGEQLNLGLLNQKTGYEIVGAALFVGGCVLAASQSSIARDGQSETGKSGTGKALKAAGIVAALLLLGVTVSLFVIQAAGQNLDAQFTQIGSSIN